VAAIEGAGDPRGIQISVAFGLWRGRRDDGKQAHGSTVEQVLAQFAPDAPEEKVRGAAEVIEGILGFGDGEK